MSKTQGVKQARKGRRWIKWVVGVPVVLVLLVLLLPSIVSTGPVERWVQKRIGAALGSPFSFDDLSVGWFSGIRVKGLNYADARGATSVSVEDIQVTPSYGSLLSGRISGDAVVDRPKVSLVAMADSPQAQPAPTPSQPSSLTLGQVDLRVNNGDVSVARPPAQAVRMAEINLHVRLEPPGKASRMEFSMAVPQGDQTAQVKADVSLQRPSDPKASPLQGDWKATAAVTHLDLGPFKPVFDLVKAPVQAEGRIEASLEGQGANGQVKQIKARVTGQDLVVTGPALSGDRLGTKTLDVQADVQGTDKALDVQTLSAKGDWFNFQAKGQVPLTSTQDLRAMALKGTLEVDVAQVASQLPKTLKIQDSVKIRTGQVQGSASLAGGRVEAQVSLANLTGTANAKAVSLSQPVSLKVQAQVAGDRILIEQADLTASFAQVQAKGDAQRIEHKATIDLQRLQDEWGRFVDLQGYRFAGKVAADGVITMSADKQSFQGGLTVDQLQITGPNAITISEPKARFDYALDLTADQLTVRSVQAQSNVLALEVKDAAIPLAFDKAKPTSFPVTVSRFDLSQVRPWLVASGKLSKDAVLSGVVSAPMQVTIDSKVFTIASDKTRIDRPRYSDPNFKNPYEPSEVLVAFKVSQGLPDGALDATVNLQSPVSGSAVELPSAEVRYKTAKDTSRIDGKAQYAYDLAKLTPTMAQWLPQDMLLAGRRQRQLVFAGEYPTAQPDQLLTRLTAGAGLGFDKAGYLGMDVGVTDANMVLRQGLLRLMPFDTIANEGKLRFGCQMDLTSSPPVVRIGEPTQILKDVHITRQMADKALYKLNPIFANIASAEGKVSLHCQRLVIPVGPTLDPNSVDIEATIAMDEVLLGGAGLLGEILSAAKVRGSQRFAMHPTHFTVNGGIVKYDDMQIDVGSIPINFAGSVGPGDKLQLSVTLPYTFAGGLIKTGQSSDSRITIPLSGTISRPKLDTAKLLEQAPGQILQALPDLFNKKKK